MSYAGEVAADAPVLWSRLADTTGTTMTAIPTTYNGTYTATPTLNVASLVATDTADRAVTFNGTTQYASFGGATNAALDFTGDVTVEAWIRPSTIPAAGVFRTITGRDVTWLLQIIDNRVQLRVDTVPTANTRVTSPASAIAANTTYHVAGVRDGTTLRMYINGLEVATAPIVSDPLPTNDTVVRVASFNGSAEFWAGTIDEPAVYSKALSPARIAAHYSEGVRTLPFLTMPRFRGR
jgi:formylmethanofuran:tetrahydromethanopterin formyltransferase